MSPMWLTSNTPTPVRTARCSFIRPPGPQSELGYSMGISQPPKSTILAPIRRCTPFRAVLRRAGIVPAGAWDNAESLGGVDEQRRTIQGNTRFFRRSIAAVARKDYLFSIRRIRDRVIPHG